MIALIIAAFVRNALRAKTEQKHVAVCTQNCRQGRDCTCRAPTAKKD
jgi:hypothetical protein